MSTTDHPHGHAGHGHDHGGAEAPQPHVMPKIFYYGVLAALLLLTFLTVATAQVNLGPFNVPIAMGIATAKATLVLAFFMHLYWDNKFNLLIFVTSILFLSIFIIITMLDTEGRNLVDRQRSNFLPRDEFVAKKREADSHYAPRPGEPAAKTEGRDNYNAFQEHYHAEGGHAEGGEAAGHAAAEH